MSHTTPSSVRRVFVVVVVAGVLGCGSDLLLPEPPGGGENVALSKVDGDGQIGTVGEALQEPLIVQVLTERQHPAPGRRVAFGLGPDSSAGQVTPDIAVTNEAGLATARWQLGTAPGSHVVVARLLDVEGTAQEFRADARAAPPDTMSPQSVLAQPGRMQRAVGTPPVVRIVDRYGNPVENVPVAWHVTSGGGAVESPITATDAEGKASVEWTLGGRIGVHKLVADIGSVTGSPVTFTATVLF
jgi:hypothetical protein